jgi:hypothetical protein
VHVRKKDNQSDYGLAQYGLARSLAKSGGWKDEAVFQEQFDLSFHKTKPTTKNRQPSACGQDESIMIRQIKKIY